jgi:hypothetical protein
LRALVRSDRGSAIPLILGCWLLGMLIVAGSVAAGDAATQQRELESTCDAAAAAAAAGGADLAGGRGTGDFGGGALRLTNAQQAIDEYVSDESISGVEFGVELSPDGQTVTVRCVQTSRIAFGWLFGKSSGVRHRAVSYARAPTS